MEDDYIHGEKRAPNGSGFVVYGLAGIGFWIALGVMVWLAG